MILHVSLFKLRPELDAERVEEILREARVLLLKVPGVCGLRCGHRKEAGDGWGLFLMAELDSREKLDAYLRDPLLQRLFAEVLGPNTTDKLSLEFDGNPGADILLS